MDGPYFLFSELQSHTHIAGLKNNCYHEPHAGWLYYFLSPLKISRKGERDTKIRWWVMWTSTVWDSSLLKKSFLSLEHDKRLLNHLQLSWHDTGRLLSRIATCQREKSFLVLIWSMVGGKISIMLVLSLAMVVGVYSRLVLRWARQMTLIRCFLIRLA